MNTLTNEQKARLFARYLGQTIQYEYVWGDGLKTSEGTLFGINIDNDCCLVGPANVDNEVDIMDCQMILTPLSEIADEHAIYILGLQRFEITKVFREDNYIAFNYRYVPDNMDLANDDGFCYAGYTWYFNQQHTILNHDALRMWGYDTGQYIEPNHPDNGKTMIELGLAVKKEKV